MRRKRIKQSLIQSRQSKNVTHTCKACFTQIESNTFSSLFFAKRTLCYNCFQKLKILDKNLNYDGVKGLVLYEYNDFLKEMIFKFKGCGDIELSPIFIEYRKMFLKLKFWNYVVVPAPSSLEDDKKREFNHVVEIYKHLGLKIYNCFEKKEKFKQSDLKAKERNEIINKLKIKNVEVLHKKNVLLVDDLTTTGSTLKAMIKLIKSSGIKIKKMNFLVICSPPFGKE